MAMALVVLHIVADSGQGYRDRGLAVKMARQFMGGAVLEVEPSDEENEE